MNRLYFHVDMDAAGLIKGAEAFKVLTYVLATISICVVAAASIWFATRRIAKRDVVEILHAE
jgi:purine-nucleoside phosphorylase